MDAITRRVALAAAAVVVCFAVWIYGDWSPDASLQSLDDVLATAMGVPAMIAALLAARAARGRHRAGWGLMGIGLAAWTAGMGVWSAHELSGRPVPLFSIADALYLAFPLCAALGLLMFWNQRGLRSRGRIVLDGVIVGGSLFAVSWIGLTRKVFAAGEVTATEFAVQMIYPTVELAALTVAALVLLSAPADQRIPLTFVTLGLACVWFSDSSYALHSMRESYFAGNTMDVGWVAAMAFLTVAGTAGRSSLFDEPALDDIPGWASVWLPYLPLMVAAGVLAESPTTLMGSPVVFGVGAILSVAVLARQFLDVSENRRLLAAVTAQAVRDPLTGLANRALFEDRLQRAMARRDASGTGVGVLALDLDGFKGVNDTLGHAVGDRVLKAAGGRILSAVRAQDTVSRPGGDEFAVLIEGEPHLMGTIAERVAAGFRQPVDIGGHTLAIRASVGWAVAEAHQDISAEELLHHADLAMYAAKRSASTEVRSFSPDLLATDEPAGLGQPSAGASRSDIELMQ